MTRRRAIPADEPKASVASSRLPVLYSTLSPLSPERHGSLRLKEARDFSFAAAQNAIPLSADEFPAALRDYPIVIADGAVPAPVALLGLETGKNPMVDADGAWQSGKYIPAYLRRWPFLMVEEGEGADRSILCADLGATMFTEQASEGQPLFEDAKPSASLQKVLDFATKLDASTRRTRAMMQELQKLDLLQPSQATITRDGRTLSASGFLMVAEDKLRALPDDVLAGLARRGVLALITTHHLSLGRFSEAWS